MRVLVLSNTPFLPATAGNRQRIDQLLGHLAAHGAEIAVLMLPAADIREWDVDGMRERVRHFEVVEPREADARRPLSRLTARLSARLERDAGIDDWCPTWFRARVAAFARDWAPDVALVVYVFLSACLEDVDRRSSVAVIDTQDLMHRRRAVYARAGLRPQWFYTSYAEERRGLARADVLLAIQEDEAVVLREMAPGATVLTVPPGRTLAPAPPSRARRGRLLFAASYNDLNVCGLGWFIDRVWPRLCADLAGIELHVCGTICQKLASMPAGVVVRGVVPALDEEYAEARVVIDPVRWGTGLPVKVVEALCHGRPVVCATGDATRPAPDGVVRTETAEEFAAAVAALLTDDARWERTTAAAVEAARGFSSEVAFAPLLAHLARAVAALGERPSAGH